MLQEHQEVGGGGSAAANKNFLFSYVVIECWTDSTNYTTGLDGIVAVQEPILRMIMMMVGIHYGN